MQPPCTPAPTSFTLPDLVSHCKFPLRISRHRKTVTSETKRWLFKCSGNLMGQKRAAYHGLNAGLLTSMCYPRAGHSRLRLCNDFLTYLFHIDNLSDDMTNLGTKATADIILNTLYHPTTYRSETRIHKMTLDFWRRLIQTGSRGTQQRFIETFDFFFAAVTEQARDRQAGIIPDLESYIMMRRDTSGCKPTFVLIEYANNLDIPDEVMEHPLIRNLGEAANDLVTWSNDLFSYNVEQSKGDNHNMIPVVMAQRGLRLQEAVDFVGDLCLECVDRFEADKAALPSWGPEIDAQVETYVQGLADWMVGSLHWSFESERYFGKGGRQVKQSRVVNLLPPRVRY
ncbi:terpenoid synthase [Cylindrobasidium torrendii FP15055 ss-10]|uniref:Terpene synthase n=1 Tax=Cylindrobasidium torrendii FP15055 ss-10 TaxID=1314674 RepID=A0A0D7BM87_9AGAR|nr:terpenoid synthase [Cylindrobasidium torrendii FP15055 ss-10]